jgi:caffeoyl-CoA O-methyltransferase
MDHLIADPQSYFENLRPRRTELLKALEQVAEAEAIPIVGPVVGELLHILARFGGARRILELGTATGYSAIYMGTAVREVNGRLVSLENDPGMAARARRNLLQAHLERWVEVVEGDALKFIESLSEPFDMVFMDIEKADYITALPHISRLTRVGGLLVVDNTRFKDADPFNQAIRNDPHWRWVNLFAFLPRHSPEQDGLCLALRV